VERVGGVRLNLVTSMVFDTLSEYGLYACFKGLEDCLYMRCCLSRAVVVEQLSCRVRLSGLDVRLHEVRATSGGFCKPCTSNNAKHRTSPPLLQYLA
jgi:hypothetical protein